MAGRRRPAARAYSSETLARRHCRDGEVVVRVGGQWGVLPAFVEVEGANGEPLRQPVGEFLEGYWRGVESVARKEVAK